MAEDNQTQEQQTETPQETQQVDTKPEFSIPTEALDVIGEGKKYKNVDDALRSVPHAQEHIKTLETEMAELKEELAKRKTTEELLDEVKSGFQPSPTTEASEINQDRIMELVNQGIQQRDKAAKAQANADQVAAKFTSQYGDKAQDAYNQLAKEAGLTTEQLNNLAATSPNVVLKLSGLEKTPQPVMTSSSSVNTEALKQQPTEELSARVPKGASTKDLLKAWNAAGEKVKKQFSN